MKDTTITILGLTIDNEWTFKQHIQAVANKMKLIRIKCINLIRSNRNSITADIIKTMIQNMSVSLMNYAGNIWMNQSSSTDPVQVEYHKSIRLLNPKIKRLSIDAMLNFNGFDSFDMIRERINAKTFSKILRVHSNNGIFIHKQKMIKECEEWTNRVSVTFEIDHQSTEET